jgi:hypothetical protein
MTQLEMRGGMKRNTYDITVAGRKLKGFEFIVGPMAGLSIPQPPRAVEDFILGAFEGGATPIVGHRDIEVDKVIADIRQIKRKMVGRYFGVNVLGVWKMAPKFISKFNELGDDSPDFLDVNGVELYFDAILPLLKDVKVPITLGIHQPVSIHGLKKELLKGRYAFLIERIQAGTLRLCLPQGKGGGHLPILIKRCEKLDWLSALLEEVQQLEAAIGSPVPFIVEKGMTTVDDFVRTIVEYSRYESFSGVRFASNLELTRESGLNVASKLLLTEIVKEQKRDMIIPIRSVIANSKFKGGMRVRGGLIVYVVATRIAGMIHKIQCEHSDFPRLSRTYNPTVLVYQAGKDRRRVCHLCFQNCPLEYCELKGAHDAVSPDSDVDDALIIVSPRIIDMDQRYIGAPVSFVVHDLIEKTLARIRSEYS